MIEKYDDTLKNNIAPQKKEEESKPGASNIYADTQGETVFEEPILKGGYNNWSKPNDYKNNNILNTKADPFGIRKLFEPQTAVAINKDDFINDSIKNASLSELKEKGNLINQTANVKKKQEEYKIC